MTSNVWRGHLRTSWVYLGVLVVATWVRLTSLGEGFWIDEVMSAAIVSDPWSLMLTRIGFTDVHPPGYYMVLKAWALLWGEGDLALRSLSMVAGLATLLLVMHWLRVQTQWSVALLGGALLACSPFHGHYSVEVRAYALFTLVALGLAWRVDRWLRDPSSRGLWPIVIIEVLTLGMHYYGLIWVALLNLYVFCTDRLRGRAWRKEWLKGQCAALAVFAGWLPLLFIQVFELPAVMKAHLSDELPVSRILAAVGPLPSADPSALAIGVGAVIVTLACVGAWVIRNDEQGEDSGSCHEPSSLTLGTVLGIALATLVMPLFALMVLPMSDSLLEAYLRQLPWAYGALVVVASLGGFAAWMTPSRFRPPMVVWLMIGGPLLVFILNQLQPMLFLRNLLVFVPLVILCACWSLRSAPRWLHVVLTILVLIAGGLHADQGSNGFMPRQDFKGATEALASSPKGTIIVAPAWDAEGVSRYVASGKTVVPVMSAHEIASVVRDETSVVVLLARPERFSLGEAEVEALLGPLWNRQQAMDFRGHRGAMRWISYRRAGAP